MTLMLRSALGPIPSHFMLAAVQFSADKAGEEAATE